MDKSNIAIIALVVIVIIVILILVVITTEMNQPTVIRGMISFSGQQVVRDPGQVILDTGNVANGNLTFIYMGITPITINQQDLLVLVPSLPSMNNVTVQIINQSISGVIRVEGVAGSPIDFSDGSEFITIPPRSSRIYMVDGNNWQTQ